MELLIVIATSLTAIFTGYGVFLVWKSKQPSVQIFAEKYGEHDYKCELTLKNNSDFTAKLNEIKVHRPLYSTVCPLAGVRADPSEDIRDTRRYSSSFATSFSVEPGMSDKLVFFFNNHDKSESNMLVRIRSSWSRFPIIEKRIQCIKIKTD